ncbi:MAG TPA: MarR family transcriptional regulator [Terriglobales bacterium]|nr:MarR family transcriptional regulator [Terriglobales bacterium]
MARTTDIAGWYRELERLARLLGQVGPDEICCEGLTSRQCSILRTLVQQEGARLSDLAQAAGISPSAMTRVLERLEKLGLVRRVRGAQKDGRAARVEITAEGRKVRQRIDRLMGERTTAIVDAIPAASRNKLLDALHMLNCCIERGGGCGFAAAQTGAERKPQFE